MKYIVSCLFVLLPLSVHAQYSTEAFQVKKLSDQYDQRGYMSGQPITVDGKLSLANANGVPSYSYPISSYTNNGHAISVSLNYCGSVPFSTFHRYYDNGVSDNWSKYHKSAPLWILNVNGFAVQTLSFASTFYNDPFYMKRNNVLIQPPLTKYTDKNLVWTVEGYDYCNRMKHLDIDNENMQDVIRLLRGDGGVLELRNAVTYDNIPNGQAKSLTNTALYTGDYYPQEINSAGYARVMFDSAYIKPGFTMAEPFKMPRILKYYPGDGLEYVFREFNKPYGKEPIDLYWTNGNTGMPYAGGIKAGPTIFYLEEINDGSYTVIKFNRSRHFENEQTNLHPDRDSVPCEPTRGRALCTGFTGHTLIYGSSSFVIQAMGRTTTVKFATAQFGQAFKENLVGNSDMFAWAQDGADKAGTSDQTSMPNLNQNSYVGLVTSITDPEKRVTQFEYEKYKVTYQGVGFPHDLNYEDELPVELVNYRLVKVSEPTSEQRIEYYGSTIATVQAAGGELISADPAVQLRIKYTLNSMVKALKKYDRNGNHLTSQKFSINNQPVAVAADFPGYLQEHWVSTDSLIDEVTKQKKWTDYHYHRYEFFSFKRSYQNNQSLPYTQVIATKEVAGNQEKYTETHYAKIGDIMYKPTSKMTKVSYDGGVFVTKNIETYQYETAIVRSYPTNIGLRDTLGKEVTEYRTLIKNPANPDQVLLKKKENFLHIPLHDTTLFIRERYWNKFAAFAEYWRQDSLARRNGYSIKWEDVMGCVETFDTLETTGKRTLPPIYNLNVRTVLTDEFDVVLHGTSRLYSTVYRQFDSTAEFRGALLADSAIGRNGVQTLTNRYTYWGGINGFNKTLLRTKTNVNGSTTEFLYDYGCPSGFNSGFVKKNDNTTTSAYLSGRQGINEYESALGQEQTVRSYNGGLLQTNTLRQMYERTYFDQISASVDPNGWYSRFAYDNNGRLKTAWLPYDFQGDSLYRTDWYGKLTVEMSGLTLYRRTYDTAYCNGTLLQGEVARAINYSRMVAAKPVTQVPGCGGSGMAAPLQSSKKEEVLLANKIVFENNKSSRGYCSGATSQEIADAVSLDEATLIMHVSKVSGKCVNLRISVLERTYLTNKLGDNLYDTLLAKTFVLNCSDVTQVLKKSSAMKRGSNDPKERESVLLSESVDLPYQQLKMDLNKIRTDLTKADWVIEVDVLTPGAEVEFVADAPDYAPRLELRGSFSRVYELADYTLHYEHLDAGKKPLYPRTISKAKLDDSLHTFNTVGSGSTPMDNSRFTERENWFGGDYQVTKAVEVIGIPGLPSSWKDSVLYSYTGGGKQRKVSDQLGDTSSVYYDEAGRQVKTFNDGGTWQEFVYQTGVAAALVGDNDQDFYGYAEKTTAINEVGVRTVQYFDAFGRLRREIADEAFLKLTTKYEYDILGRLATVVNPKGDTTRYWYDEYSRIRYKYQPDMGYYSYSYDKAGNVRFTQTAEQAGNGQLTFTQYDDLNRVTLIGEADLDDSGVGGGGEDPPHGIVAGGTPGERTGTGKREQVMSFPPHPVVNLGRLTDALDASYLHDDATSGIITANKTVWQTPQVAVPSFWLFSSLAETWCIPQPIMDVPVPPYITHSVQNYTDPGLPLALSTSFENIARYPQNARIAVQYDGLPVPGGSVWTYFPAHALWDSLAPTGRIRNLKSKEAAVAYRQHAGEPYHFVVMSYDERGRMEALLHYTENLGFDAVYYTYNSMNMITSVRVVDPHRQYTTWYGYNPNGLMDSVWSKLSAPGSGLGITGPAYRQPESRPQDAEVVYTYTKRGQVENTIYPAINTLISFAYNGRTLLDSLVATKSGTQIFRQVLSYGSDGNITGQKWQHGMLGEKQRTYEYDQAKRLRFAWNQYNVDGEQYTYDAVGNRLAHANYAGGVQTWNDVFDYTGAGGANRLWRIIRGDQNQNRDTTTYSYNANGSMIGQSYRVGGALVSETMKYSNTSGQLIRYTRTQGALDEDWCYRAGSNGEREQKRRYSSTQSLNNEWTYYLLSPIKQQLVVYKGIETNQTSCGQTVGNMVYLSPSSYHTYGASGDVSNLTVRPQPGGMSRKEYTIADHIGSTRVVLDQYGNSIGNYDYDSFGDVEWSTAPAQRKSWLGKEKDYESNMSDFGARKYIARSGRFTVIDPYWEKFRSLTPYQYSRNNPLNRTDKNGLWDVVVQFSKDREGNPIGQAFVYDRHGHMVWTFYVRGTGVGGHNRMKKYADTPLGVYDIPDDYAWKKGGKRSSYGPNYRLNLVGVSGEIVKSGRTDIRVHGGGQEYYDKDKEQWVAKENPELKPTRGCMRAHEADIRMMKMITDKLEDSDPLERPGTLTVTDTYDASLELSKKCLDCAPVGSPQPEPSLEGYIP